MCLLIFSFLSHTAIGMICMPSEEVLNPFSA
uniref:Uncharacterized protein n=1 Tax=Rhizophora mucronata TaxID=61149 RepID=A0A2P2PY80_RHIMU